ncbi:MAG: tetratricopeptide repeat protein, partial [Deltaproteobacteria bacterium]
AALALVAFVARRWLPDPVVWLGTARSVREKRARAAALPADLLTRRDLSRLLIARGRPRDAVPLLEEAIAKGLHDPETFYLLGLSRLRSGDPAGSLEPFVRTAQANGRFLMGDPYVAAAQALTLLARHEEAEDALDHALAVNSSRVDAHVALARVRTARGDLAGARRAYDKAIETWGDLPDFMRWKTLSSYLAARWGRWAR